MMRGAIARTDPVGVEAVAAWCALTDVVNVEVRRMLLVAVQTMNGIWCPYWQKRDFPQTSAVKKNGSPTR